MVSSGALQALLLLLALHIHMCAAQGNTSVLVVYGTGFSVPGFQASFPEYIVTDLDDLSSASALQDAALLVDLVYVDASVSGGTLAFKLADTPTPLVNANDGSASEFRLGSDPSTVPFGTTVDFIGGVLPGIDAGSVAVYSNSGELIPLTQPTPGAIPFTTTELGFLYESGLDAPGGALPARRVHMFGDEPFSKFTAEGITVLRAVFQWVAAPPGVSAIPTLAPTGAPSANPTTASPTAFPTASPTSTPTVASGNAGATAAPTSNTVSAVNGQVTYSGNAIVSNATFSSGGRLNVTGTATLQGDLVIQLTAAIPPQGVQLQLISAAQVSGSFDSVSVSLGAGASLPPGCSSVVTPQYGVSSVSVLVRQRCGLSTGGLVGVILGALLAVVLLGFIPLYCHIRRRNKLTEQQLNKAQL